MKTFRSSKCRVYWDPQTFLSSQRRSWGPGAFSFAACTHSSHSSDFRVALVPELEAQLVGKETSFLASDLEKPFFPFLI